LTLLAIKEVVFISLVLLLGFCTSILEVGSSILEEVTFSVLLEKVEPTKVEEVDSTKVVEVVASVFEEVESANKANRGLLGFRILTSR